MVRSWGGEKIVYQPVPRPPQLQLPPQQQPQLRRIPQTCRQCPRSTWISKKYLIRHEPHHFLHTDHTTAPSEAGSTLSLLRIRRQWNIIYLSHWQQVSFACPPHQQGQVSFFVGKKDDSLRPCIDVWGLYDITLKIVILCL